MNTPHKITTHVNHVSAAIVGTSAERDDFADVKLAEERERIALGITDEAFAAADYDHDFAMFVRRQELEDAAIAERVDRDQARAIAYRSWRNS